MIETLIAIVVVSIGLLGMAGLHMSGLKSVDSSYRRTVAAYQAYDMADRMRANMQGVRGGSYDSLTVIPTGAPTCISTNCTPVEMAQNDLFEWNGNNTRLLPRGIGVVCLDGTPNDGTFASPACDASGTLYAIKIWWDEDRSGTVRLYSLSFKR